LTLTCLPRSIGFYSALFAAQPAVIKFDYAKWMPDDPRVNFAISTHGREPGLDHLGIQVEDRVRRAVAERLYNVLSLCTGNSARSIIAEAILNKLGAGRFLAYSAGSQPRGAVNPHTIALLQSLDYDTSGFRSKSWGRVCQAQRAGTRFRIHGLRQRSGRGLPVWPGQPMTAHWGIPDPAEAKGTPAEIALAFKDAYRMLNQRIGIFTVLPLRSLDQLSLQNKLREIGQMQGATAKAAEPT